MHVTIITWLSYKILDMKSTLHDWKKIIYLFYMLQSFDGMNIKIYTYESGVYYIGLFLLFPFM